MAELPTQPVSELLAKWGAGDEESLHRLVPLVYGELRRIAHCHFRNERPGHTLQTTALVHEAYLCLMKQHQMNFQNREHFFAVSANLMRQILVQYARRRNAAKRNGGNRVALDNVRLDSAVALFPKQSVDLVALNEALNALAKLDAQQSTIVELRFFAGLSIEETSRVLGVSPATIKRDWTTARIWLSRQMGAETPHDHP
ncbi:MAG TPA: sigma-70 family RNA polymerase sigma factor [Terriglobales bacterium]|jgi:RNA polymerase sigma factor (TIGR02999 family)|nr:sigma-70 family RNA polymerase sigma factor [Terriglobales bacterium]